MRLSVNAAVLATLAACVALGGCKHDEKQRNKHKERVWSKRTPYGFHRAVGRTLLKTHQPRRAMLHLRKLVEMRPKEAEGHYLMGRAYIEIGRPPQARSHLERALELDPRRLDAREALGLLLDRIGEHSEAEKHHRRCVKIALADKLGPSKRTAYFNNLGFCLYLQKRHREAIGAYTKALAIQPATRRIHNNLGFAYAAVDRLARAYHHFRRGGIDAEADNNMGYVYEGRGELQRAYSYYLRAARKAPQLVRVRENLTRICHRLGRKLPKLLRSGNKQAASAPSGGEKGG